MNIALVWEICCLLLLGCVALGRALMCVQCSSHDDKMLGDCAYRPDPPSTCLGSSGTKSYCTITREIDSQGTQFGFIRSCTATKMSDNGEEFCMEVEEAQRPLAKICRSSCDYDGCNAGRALYPSHILVASVLSVAVLVMAIL